MGNIIAILKAEFDAQQRGDFQTDASQFMRLVVRAPGFRIFWKRRKSGGMYPAFDAYVDTILQDAGPALPASEAPL